MNILDLPPEMQDYILSFVASEDLLNIIVCSRHFNVLVKQNQFFNQKLKAVLYRKTGELNKMNILWWAIRNCDLEVFMALYFFLNITEGDIIKSYKHAFKTASVYNKLSILNGYIQPLIYQKKILNK
jgi:hypothetical protein